MFLQVLQKLTSTNLFQVSLFILDPNLSQWLLFKTWLLITTTKNLVKRKNGFEFPLQTSEQKQNNTKKTFASHREVCIVKGNDNKAPTTLITFVLISG